jgi:hypothetical protein
LLGHVAKKGEKEKSKRKDELAEGNEFAIYGRFGSSWLDKQGVLLEK